MSIPTPFYYWLFDGPGGKRQRTTWRMDEARAKEHFKGRGNPEPILASVEIRNLPEGPHEWGLGFGTYHGSGSRPREGNGH